MTDNFFTGGTLPSDDLLLYFQKDVQIVKHWRVNGVHYQKTLEGWLDIMDSKKAIVLPLLAKTYGDAEAMKRYVYWRLFFM
jgi:cyclopropane-fatty-acyl-phospholipid synthase